ncbi:MAG: Nif3-like dinuclear metal center hexameric protein, partial [Chloroflexi bacterium]|nr:Nif3-like dinuclear metal center hexameric protein [Chloroflexota bacterium]
MRAIDVDRHMRRVGTWVDWTSTVDTFKAGDPATEVRGIAVAWPSTWPALREAHRLGCNLFVTHETTFSTPTEDDSAIFATPPARTKRSWLEETGMVVYRCHDVWDVMPQWGVLDRWAGGLGWPGPPLAAQKYYAVYAVPGGVATVRDLARHVLYRTTAIGQE